MTISFRADNMHQIAEKIVKWYAEQGAHGVEVIWEQPDEESARFPVELRHRDERAMVTAFHSSPSAADLLAAGYDNPGPMLASLGPSLTVSIEQRDWKTVPRSAYSPPAPRRLQLRKL